MVETEPGLVSENDEYRECDNPIVTFVPAHVLAQRMEEFGRLMERAKSGIAIPPEQASAWFTDSSTTLYGHARELPCQFRGVVTVYIWDDDRLTWTCPRCGSTVEEDAIEHDERIRSAIREEQEDLARDQQGAERMGYL